MTDSILVDIEKISVGNRHRKSLGDLHPLMESIEELGLLHPVVITDAYELVAGERRIEAARQLGWVDIPARILPLSPAEMLRAEHDENVIRLDFRPSEMVALGRKIEEVVARQARERQEAQEFGRGVTDGESPQVKGSTRDIVGKAVGVSGSTYEKAKRVVEAAESDPDEFGDLAEKMDKSGKVWPTFNELKARETGGTRPSPSATNTRVMKGNEPSVVVTKAISTLSGVQLALERVDPNALADKEEASQWTADLSKAASFLRSFVNQLKEATNG